MLVRNVHDSPFWCKNQALIRFDSSIWFVIHLFYGDDVVQYTYINFIFNLNSVIKIQLFRKNFGN